jgi:outer membrane protein assembly factor BamA
LPYEKFLFAGGSNSIRAWRPRRLGPGSYKPERSADPVADGLYSYSIEKPAEILVESSMELRKKLFGFVSGALFIDAGNVWTFDQRVKSLTVDGTTTTVQNGNSQFRVDEFYKEIAVGTGFGLRFDFTFLILRLDVGMKVYDPARDENDRFVLDEVRFWRPYAKTIDDGKTYYDFREPVIYNVGIGYSF